MLCNIEIIRKENLIYEEKEKICSFSYMKKNGSNRFIRHLFDRHNTVVYKFSFDDKLQLSQNIKIQYRYRIT